jgi:osmotically-inducible protein OsmY
LLTNWQALSGDFVPGCRYPWPKGVGMASRRIVGWVLGLVLIGTLGLCGCTTVVWETAKKLRENRISEDQFTDSKISANLMAGLAEQSQGLLIDVNADVWETRVLLTGMVTDASVRQLVVRKVCSDKRILKIYDEIQVVSAADQAKRREAAKSVSRQSTANQPDNDFWVETKISAKLLSAQNVTSVNYRWRSVRNTLYVIGCAQSKQELALVLAIIKATEGVARIKSFIDIKPT